MKINQDGNRIVATELNPMGEAPRTGHIIQLFALDSHDENDSIPVYARWVQVTIGSLGYGHWQDIEDKDEQYTDSMFIGWIPMPIYEPCPK